MSNETVEIEVLKIADLMILLGGVSYTTAARRMREVKAISDILHIKGCIHKRDWQHYLDFMEAKNANR